ncbi:MAG: GntP family permease [Lachnospiraceae bacterium]|nr:GntP family permease [Lachnospiraceae bacterium]
MPYGLVFIIGILVLLFFIVKLKTNAFIGLLAATFTIGACSGMPLTEVVSTISEGFGGTVTSIGLVIIFGTILGKYLEVTNSTDRMALSIVGAFGESNTALAMGLAGYIISIPVFSDSAMVILSPLVLALAAKNRKPLTAIAVLGVSLASGLLSTNVFFPPTPGPLAAAGMLNIDIGQAMLFGGLIALVRTLFGWGYAKFFLDKKEENWFSYDNQEIIAAASAKNEEKDMPGLFGAILPLLLPLVLILFNTFSKMIFGAESSVVAVTSFIGDPIIALVIGCVCAMIIHRNTLHKDGILSTLTAGLKESGTIVFVVSAGGALGSILKASGVGTSLAESVASLPIPTLLIPFLIGATIKMINGSGTTALITAVTICEPMVAALGISPIIVFLAACCGASICSHINDSFFWVYSGNLGMDMKTGLKTLSASCLVATVGALGATFILSLFL